MRLRRLDLIRYGKFTDTTVELPPSDFDFHFIVGPNEAGKSTVRSAVAELLFGMPRSSSMGFVHPQSDLRLGALIDSAAGRLEFHRTKSTKSPLRSPDDQPLPDDVLAAHLSGADRAFFEQMFGLDHTQLVKGGQSILDASNDVGQVLFQSSAGIAGLGKIREQLAAEAASVWAPRKSADRSYYIAAVKLDEAERELKEATVRTRAWADARGALDAAEGRLDEIRRSLRTLENDRARLERVRRLAPLLQTCRSKTAELAALGDVVDLPADAARLLSEGQSSLAGAQAVLEQRQKDVERLQAERDAIQYDDAILALHAEIDALEQFRHRVRDHARDIELRQNEVRLELEQIKTACRELGWPDDETRLRASLPSVVALKTVDRLLKTQGGIAQQCAAADKTLRTKAQELADAEQVLATLPEPPQTPALSAALAEAQAYRNSPATQQNLKTLLTTAERALADALDALGSWKKPVAELKSIALPSAERLSALCNERTRLEADVTAARTRLAEVESLVANAELAVKHYTEAARIVTGDEVRTARLRRDETWGEIKSGQTPLELGAPALDLAIGLADELVDTQLGSATEAAELQSRRQQLERETANLERARLAAADSVAALRAFDERWAAEAAGLSVDGLPLIDAPAWSARRDAALHAAAVVAQKREELEAERAATASRWTALEEQLAAVGCAPVGGGLAAACDAAEQYLRELEQSCHRREMLVGQINKDRTVLNGLRDDAKTAKDALARWSSEWAEALAATGLTAVGTSTAAVESALDRITGIYTRLDKVDGIRRDRIEAMQRDLDHFAKDAQAIVGRLDAEMPIPGDANACSKQLGERLAAARKAQQQWSNADLALHTAIMQRDAAQLDWQAVNARLLPLMKAAGVVTPADAAPLVERSDARRALRQAIDAAKSALAADAEGLDFDAVAAEVDAVDISSLAGRLETLKAEVDEVREQSTAATEQRLRAQQAYDAIAGGANAAIAEAKRQEALAAMADAAERYVKVQTAVRLLRWAIDNYRDRKQGPMLARAGAIFSGLTLGRYRKLLVDYDKEPLSLAAQRETGEVVEIPGLSEGTRDQLYLALRLAALELRAEQASPLPFIADDLFINFDDARSRAGLEALRLLSRANQVLFLSHHDHLLPIVREVFGAAVNVVELQP